LRWDLIRRRKANLNYEGEVIPTGEDWMEEEKGGKKKPSNIYLTACGEKEFGPERLRANSKSKSAGTCWNKAASHNGDAFTVGFWWGENSSNKTLVRED
jgi:hypothetical protein